MGPMQKFGLDNAAAIKHLQRQMDTIDIIDDLAGKIRFPVSEGSDLASLASLAPDAPVPLIGSIRVGLATAHEALTSMKPVISAALPGAPPLLFLQCLTRAALLGAGRVVFVLGPDGADTRRNNAQIVVKKESVSLTRALERHAAFEHLLGMKPPDTFVSEVSRRATQLGGGAPPGEEKMLEQMATVIGQSVARHNPDLDAGIVTEAVASIWHRYSGAVHGYAWPEGCDGDFVSDFGIVVPVVHTAFDLAFKRGDAR